MFRRDNKSIAVWLSLTMRFSRCDLCSHGRCNEAGKFLQARSWTNTATCAESTDKKCQILNGYGGRHKNTVAKRGFCQPKHEGEYKGMLDRVLQSEAGNTLYSPAQASSSLFGTRVECLMTDFWETWIWKVTFPVCMLYCLHQHMLVLQISNSAWHSAHSSRIYARLWFERHFEWLLKIRARERHRDPLVYMFINTCYHSNKFRTWN